jgi:hypothetical protein
MPLFFKSAKELIEKGKVVRDERDAWSEGEPSTAMENEFIRLHGFREHAKWHLAIDDGQDPETKRHYKFPYGDFKKAHCCGVLTAQYKHFDVERTAARLHEMIDGIKRGFSRHAAAGRSASAR